LALEDDGRMPYWNGYRCPACGGDAPLGIMASVAVCISCGAGRAEWPGIWRGARLGRGEWLIPPEGAD